MVNLGNMMKQAQQLQKKMAEAQEKLNSIEVEGVSGGGMVKVVATAKGEVKRITLDESLIKLINYIRSSPKRDFKYFIDLEIDSNKTPKTWSDKLFQK